MLTYDFSPLFRSTVGFDRLARVVEDVMRVEQSVPAYPPYNIERTGEDAYRVSVAVAGFGQDELSVETRENALVVSGSKAKTEGEAAFLHRGIGSRDFQRTFRLADHVKAVDAAFENGLLHVDLVRELPESMKPRSIEIKTSVKAKLATKAKKLLEGEVKAA